MGEVVLAAKITHVPSIVMSEPGQVTVQFHLDR